VAAAGMSKLGVKGGMARSGIPAPFFWASIAFWPGARMLPSPHRTAMLSSVDNAPILP